MLKPWLLSKIYDDGIMHMMVRFNNEKKSYRFTRIFHIKTKKQKI